MAGQDGTRAGGWLLVLGGLALALIAATGAYALAIALANIQRIGV